MVLEADDFGRLCVDPVQLRASIVPHRPATARSVINHAIRKIARLGLIELYEVRGTLYGFFPSWHDWQKPKYPTPSRIPPPILPQSSPRVPQNENENENENEGRGVGRGKLGNLSVDLEKRRAELRDQRRLLEARDRHEPVP